MSDMTNLEPAFEEGPHLAIPRIAELKREQMIEAGFEPDDERLTDDMKRLLVEEPAEGEGA